MIAKETFVFLGLNHLAFEVFKILFLAIILEIEMYQIISKIKKLQIRNHDFNLSYNIFDESLLTGLSANIRKSFCQNLFQHPGAT